MKMGKERSSIVMKKTPILLLLLLLTYNCFSQQKKLCFGELSEKDASLNFEITNCLYQSSYEYWYSHFKYPSTIDNLFDFMFKNILDFKTTKTFSQDVKDVLVVNRSLFTLYSTQNELVILYADSVFCSFSIACSCGEFSETGSFVGFVKDNVIQKDNKANKLDKLFKHKLWNIYRQSINKLSGRHIVEKNGLSLVHVGMTYDYQKDTLVVHNICPYYADLHKKYYTSLKLLSSRFCHKNNYDYLFFSTPFVTYDTVHLMDER